MDNAIELPSAEDFEAYLDAHPPRMPSPWGVWGPIAALIAIVVVGFMIGGLAALLLPWAGLAGLFIYLIVRFRQARRLQQRVTRTQELATLRHYGRALREGWSLLPAAAAVPPLYLRLVVTLAQVLGATRAYEAAAAGYERVLDHLDPQDPAAVHVRIQHAIAALALDRLTDADDALRQLRGIEETYPDTPLSAGYHLAKLIQSVRTHHFDDPLGDAAAMTGRLRPLGVNAGYGYALLALCYDRQALPGPAAQWWKRATLLIDAPALAERFPELQPLARNDELPATQRPRF